MEMRDVKDVEMPVLHERLHGVSSGVWTVVGGIPDAHCHVVYHKSFIFGGINYLGSLFHG